jgi:hypothetical protein
MMRRFLNALNNPAVVIGVLVVVVAVNVFLYLDYRPSEEPTSSSPSVSSSGPQRTPEKTNGPSDPEGPSHKSAQPTPSPGQGATASATSSPSP